MDKKEPAADYVTELRAREPGEPIASFLGMKLLELSPGYARVSLKLRPEFRNFNGLVFGGIIMSLADQAFAYGSNSLACPSYASQFNTHFIAAPEANDELIAECRVVKSGKRVGISEVTVTSRNGKLIAKCTGTTIPVR